MRIADKMNYDQVKSNLAKNRSEMADLQNQAATQKRVTKPSDDPIAAARVLQTRTEISGNTQFLKSVNQARTFLEYSDQSLGELTEVLVRAKELALSQASDASASKGTREVTASEISQLHDQSVQIGNRKIGDRFLFGGFKTTRPPFDPEGRYQGDSGEMKITINKEASVAMNIPGNRVFLGKGMKAPATAGPGPSQSFDADASDASSDSSAPAPILAPPSASETGSEIRGPASESAAEARNEGGSNLGASWESNGVNVFRVLRDLGTGLRANDKEAVQESLDRLDEAMAQVVLARSQLGARVMTLNSATETLQKGQVDAKTLASNLEDADTFELVSDLNKSESTLKASLATSGKLIQPSLLDFLR